MSFRFRRERVVHHPSRSRRLRARRPHQGADSPGRERGGVGIPRTMARFPGVSTRARRLRPGIPGTARASTR